MLRTLSAQCLHARTSESFAAARGTPLYMCAPRPRPRAVKVSAGPKLSEMTFTAAPSDKKRLANRAKRQEKGEALVQLITRVVILSQAAIYSCQGRNLRPSGSDDSRRKSAVTECATPSICATWGHLICSRLQFDTGISWIKVLIAGTRRLNGTTYMCHHKLNPTDVCWVGCAQYVAALEPQRRQAAILRERSNVAAAKAAEAEGRRPLLHEPETVRQKQKQRVSRGESVRVREFNQ
eukprot:8745599-Pyramimonas_sp.AAC.1